MATMRIWIRRASMISLYVLVWGLLTAFSPIFAIAAISHGIVKKNQQSTLRVLCGIWVFFVAELLGLAAAIGIWLRHMLSPSREHERYLAANYRLQQWWARFLLRAIFGLLRLRLEVRESELSAPGPIVMFMNHASFIDTLLPIDLVCRAHGMRLRYALKKELLIDPCLDIVGNRLPNYFVDRAGVTESEIAGIRRMADDLGERDGIMIFPEGTRFTPAKRHRVLAKIKERSPDLHERAQQLEHVLPPRLGGALALLDVARRSGAIDVLFCVHSGMKGFASVREMLSGELVGQEVRVTFWRVPSADIPATRDEQIAWLYDQWYRVDGLSDAANAPRARAA